MDRRGAAVRPVVARQWSTNSSANNDSSSPSTMSPAGSPIHPLSRAGAGSRQHHLGGAGAFSTIKRNQNVAAKAAARRLAQAMATQSAADNDEDGGAGGDDDVGGEDEDLGFRFRPPSSFASSPNSSEDGSSRSSTGANCRLLANMPAVPGRTNRAPSPALGRTIVDHAQPARSTSTGRPSATNRTVPVALSSKNSVRTPSAIPPVELPVPARARKTKEKRLTPEIGHINLKDQGSSQDDSSALLDELDMIQGENEGLREQLRLLEIKREEAEARARQLEQQVATLGEGVSLEAKLLSRKEAALRQREAALMAAKQKKEDGKDGEMTTLRSELENLKIEASSTMDHLQQAESEAKALRIMTQRMVLTQEEMEEVVLKRCWLARYWGLAVQLGICSDVAVLKHEHWSAFAPLPFEVVFSAGQKAKEEFSRKGENGSDKESTLARDPSNLTGDGNIESMLSVEMGLRELASLKIEDAVAISMAQLRRPNFVRDYRSPAELKFSEAYELNQEESQDVNFKLAWLTYFWKRARDHGVEEDIAEERLQCWISRIGQSLTSHDAVDVGRGLIELRKLGIEQQLWEASRKEIEDLPITANGNHKQQSSSESEGSS